MAFKDLTGQRFNRLLVIKRVENDWQGNARFLCKCDCGKEVEVLGYCLRNNNTKSCGCLGRENRIKANTTHNLSKHRLHIIWDCMKARCSNRNNPNYQYYGKRGIKVCEEWKNNFLDFYNWSMANGYNDALTIDRIDANGDYKPNNCRWATLKEQNNNKRNNCFLEYNGERHTLKEWSEKLNLNYDTIRCRKSKGWNSHEILFGRKK